jgi:hypothetical protein
MAVKGKFPRLGVMQLVNVRFHQVRYVKDECIEHCQAEWQRRGFPFQTKESFIEPNLAVQRCGEQYGWAVAGAAQPLLPQPTPVAITTGPSSAAAGSTDIVAGLLALASTLSGGSLPGAAMPADTPAASSVSGGGDASATGNSL